MKSLSLLQGNFLTFELEILPLFLFFSPVPSPPLAVPRLYDSTAEYFNYLLQVMHSDYNFAREERWKYMVCQIIYFICHLNCTIL